MLKFRNNYLDGFILNDHCLIRRKSCHHIETNQLICSANQLTGFYMMETLAFNELMIILFHQRFMLPLSTEPEMFCKKGDLKNFAKTDRGTTVPVGLQV